ncbi:DUF169 domain-containing protein [Lutispora sp.]|uniref:DUF169 domain-containing protein n=1 Tax=Lutispora sp. TaxID=2828727 RepID=UPI000ED7F796|nr:DUF169 domain-containing protein [Lutispora sp.]MEA4961808.1 DUF169 domain-containing protein [Lutispora sp.]HCJ57224.1 hypothetical protein [Clostridiaceae bacterium]
MFDQNAVRRAVIKANCALEFERSIVGIKFLFTQKEFEMANAPQLQSQKSYCAMVVHAAHGKKLKADFSNFGCFGGARALGIVALDEFYTSGRFFQNRGLYTDLTTSKEVSNHISICKHRAYGVQVMPVEEFTEAPDVVIIVSNPRNIMRLVQGYTHFFGTHSTFKMIGNQAICAECTAEPYETNDISMSVLCAGPRSAGMKEYEMAIGMPFGKFERIIDGLCITITPVEHTDIKLKIIERMKQNGIDDVPIILNRNYGGPVFYQRDSVYFEKQRELKPMEQEERLPDIWNLDEK